MTRAKSLRIVVFLGLFAILFSAACLTERAFRSNPITIPNEISTTPTSAAVVDEPYTGEGNPQEVRVYSNFSYSSQNSNGSFPIDSPSEHASLSSASINYTFTENYTTLYPITPYSALDYPRVVNGTYLSHTTSSDGRMKDEVIPTTYGANTTVGKYSNWDWAHDNNIATYSNYSSSGNQLSFDIYSNFSNLLINGWVYPPYTSSFYFDRNMSMGMDLNFTANVVQTGATPFTSLAYTVLAERWGTGLETVGTGQLINNATTIQTTIYNPLDQFINETQGAHFRVTLTHSELFNLTLYEVNATVKVVQELEISQDKQVAMGFDLLGNATVNGFQVLIRTIDFPVDGVKFSASLYRANWTFSTHDIVTVDKRSLAAVPEGTALATFTSDANAVFNGIITFNFSTPVWCNLSNYFIVLNSTSTTAHYRIATVPGTAGTTHGAGSFPSFVDTDPNSIVRHIVLNSSLGFRFWNQSYLNQVENAYPLNVAPFVINVTRGWMPTDVNMSIQNICLRDVNDAEAHEFPFNGTPGWYWGRGTWTKIDNTVNDFPDPILNNGWCFNVPLTWNQTKSETILFNTTFSATSYAINNSIFSIFNVTFSQLPQWTINHTIAPDTYTNWTFHSLAFVYPKTWNSGYNRILNPSYNTITSFKTEANSTHYQLTAYNDTGVKGEFGLYSFQVESHNAIVGFESFLNWQNKYNWSTDTFMRGDNISVTMSTSIPHPGGGNLLAVRNGVANTTLFGPDGERVSDTEGTLETQTWNDIDLEHTYYKFNGVNLFNTTTTTPYGEYTAVSKWFNGSEVGFHHFTIYVANYSPSDINVYYNPELGYNFVEGNVGQNAKKNVFDLLVTTVNETTSLPRNFLPGMNVTSNKLFEGKLWVDHVILNETVFQRGEQFEVNVTVENYPGYVLDMDVQVKLELLHYSKQDWRIYETKSDIVNLKEFGVEGNRAVINITGTFPDSNTQGLNCPIRDGPVLMRLTFIVNDNEVGDWNPRFAFIQVDKSDAEFEGQILSQFIENDHDSETFQCPVNRTIGCNLPGYTHYFVDIMDDYYLSTETNHSRIVYGKALAILQNVSPLPVIPTVNRLFNFSGSLVSENPSRILSGKTVKFEFFDETAHAWNDLNGVDSLATCVTDSQGNFSKEFNASIFRFENQIRVSFAGDGDHTEGSFNYTLTVIQFDNEIKVLVDENLQLTGNLENSISFWFFNTGNSTLENLQISVTCWEDYDMQIIHADYVKEKSLSTRETVIRAYIVQIPALLADSNVTFSFTIKATAKETLQHVTFTETVTIDIAQGTLLIFSPEILPAFIFFVITGVIWLASAIFFLRKWRGMKAEPRAPRRRLVKIGPSPQVPPAKVVEVPMETKPAPQKPAAKDFDEILKEVKKDEEEDSE